MKMNENMKSILKTVASLSVLLLAASCTLEQIDTQMTPEKAKASIRLECSALESYTVQAAKPQDISFHVSATTPWTITGKDADWLTVTPASSSVSSLSEDIRITAKANNDFADRKAVLTVSGENTETSYTITVTQLRKGKLTVAPIAGEFETAGGSKTFTVEANIAWEASAADEWLTLNPASGTSDGATKSFTVTATAANNSSVTRSTTVTVAAGDEKQEFEVVQKGQTLEILPVENPTIDRKGGDLVIGVNATMDWKAESDNEAFTVTKVGNNQLKVSAGFNNQFAPRTATITVKPVSTEFGDVSSTVSVSQDINFKLEGNCEVLADGSVKLSAGAKSRVTTLDEYRYVTIILKMGDKHFESKGEMWCSVKAGGCNIYSQLSLSGNWRIRQDGNLPITKKPSGEDVSTYKNVNLALEKSADKLNAMTEYRFEVLNEITDDPDYAGVKWHVVNFWYNGVLDTTLNFRSVFADDPSAAGPYWFGYESSKDDNTWYVVKTCDVIPIAE